ncbi:MAG: aldehyde dehydrogenase family protein [Bacteroidales bacterium]
MTTEKKYHNFINGIWKAPVGGQYFNQHNPARLSEVTGSYPLSGAADTLEAIGAAEAAYPLWRSLSVHKRAEYLKRALQLMKEQRHEIAHVLTLENGKTLAESLVEVEAAVKEMDWQIAEGIRLFGSTIPSAMEKMMTMVMREPLGVASIISPWNFPFNVPCRKSIPALMAGNTCVFKPASLTPQTGYKFTRLLEDAGLPAGVFNMVIGSGKNVGDIMVSDPRINAISFTGSTEVGMHVNQRASEKGIRTQLEMGGKNPVVILEDADMDLAVKATVKAAFACAGQWCTSTSRAVVVKNRIEEFTSRVVEKTKKLTVGNGLEQGIHVGPVCGTGQMENILRYINIGKEEGARLLTGGYRLAGSGYDDGCFVAPTVFSGVRNDMTIARVEIFGPVLSIMEVEDFDHALHVANDTPFGLCSSIFTNDMKKAMRFIAGTQVGLTHVNEMTAYKEPQLPFGGIKASGFGLPEAGSSGLEFFSNQKSVYIKIP